MSAQVMQGQKSMNRRASSLLPWLLLVLTIMLGAIAVFFLLVNQAGAGREPIENLYNDMLTLLNAITGGAVGALIAARRSRNPIGWLLLLVGLDQVAGDVFGGYSTYALMTQPGAFPASVLAAWLAQWLWTLPFGALILALLIYPTGQLLSPRWRIVAWAGMVGTAALLVSAALASELKVGNGQPPLTLANPIGVINTQNIVLPILLPLLFWFVFVMIFAALVSLVIRFRRARGDERQQLKWFTYAAVLAVMTQPLANLFFGPWAQAAQNLAFLMLPLAVGIAILKYRLYDIDLLINRTLVYIPLTAILAGIFAASITLSQKLFIAITGTGSDAATVLTTLVVVAAFTPIKDRLQALVDKRFKEATDPAKKLNAFGEFVRLSVSAVAAPKITRRLLEEAVGAFEAKGGAAYLGTDAQPFYTFGEWRSDAQLNVSLQDGTSKLGSVALSARRNGAEYTAQDRETLQQIADLTASAIALDERANGVRQ